MNLKLAIVKSCSETGCRVITLDSNSPLNVNYSKLVQDRIKIRPGQMVALNTETNPPEIVWRWIRTAVFELTADVIVVDDMQGHPAQVSRVNELPLILSENDEVWACSTGSNFEVHDIIMDEKPTKPNRLIKYITPIINDIYNN